MRHDDSAMKIESIISQIFRRLVGRIIRRLLAAAVLALFILVALYHLTVAGMLALEELYGPLDARLIVVAIYAALAAIIFIYLFATRAKTPAAEAPARKTRAASRNTPQDIRVAELLESLLLGYMTARRKSRHSS